MFSIRECHCPVLLKVTPRCLWLSTKLIGILSKTSCGRKSGFLRVNETMEGENRQYSMHTSLFCMLAISFYFVNCVIIACELYYDNSFGCILTIYK